MPNYRAKSNSSKSLSIMGNSNIVHSNVASGLRQPSRSAQFDLNSDSSSSSSDESDFESRPVPRRIRRVYNTFADS
ncbi:hypothetical protein DPMN_136942 [Dreissena polymorpha]|uniref:Uncharacterized protein n=1 Tax=Dreissena polymorpha TaxID=45954 RepID=A0A9D4G0V5_DREPO|nr:hypothetical protein DPMN_136942 [Dreissena polymorpha]